MPRIPLIDVKAQYEPFLPRIREAIEAVLASGEFILGPNVAAFEREAADYVGVKESVGVANVLELADIMTDFPTWMTQAAGAAGFAELAEALIPTQLGGDDAT